MGVELWDYTTARRYLYGLRYRGARYGIERMEAFSEALGRPQDRFPSIHVAGTNGKGSTCALLESVYRHAGYTTGMFTSPHLVYQGERIQVNREILSHDQIVEYVRRLKPLAEQVATVDPELHPSFFEFMTGMAFLRFSETPVDIAMIETGLGGRLDATNVVAGEVSVITSISLDHTEILGDSLAAIAREKAGILKPGRPVVISRLPAEAESVVRERAAGLGCRVHSVKERFGDNLDDYPVCGLPGQYQSWNAGTARLVVEVLREKFPVADAQIEVGLARATWSGRWERFDLADRTVILDATHNEEGARELDRALALLSMETGRRPVIAVGTLGERRAASIMPVVARYAREIHLLEPRQPRACSYDILETALPPGTTTPVHRSKVARLFPGPLRTILGDPGDTVVVTGSIYLIGEVMDRLKNPSPADEGELQD